MPGPVTGDKAGSGAAGLEWESLKGLEGLIRAELQEAWPSDVLELHLLLRGDVVIVSGRVASLEARAAATRALLAYDRVFKIENNLEVTGFFAPAGSGDDEGMFAGPAGTTPSANASAHGGAEASGRAAGFDVPHSHEGAARPASIARHPVVEVAGRISVGSRIEVLVDLRQAAPGSPVGDPVRLAGGTEWETMIVDVQIVSAQLEEIEPAPGCITVRRDGASSPARFDATVSARAGEDGHVKVAVAFMHGTRLCGTAENTVSTEAGAPKTGAIGLKVAGRHGPGVLNLGWHGGPSMSVNIFSQGGGRLLWHWTTFPRTGAANVPPKGEVDIGDAQVFAAALIKACPGFAPEDARRRMRAIGEQVWRAAPSNFRVAYKALHATLGPGFTIQVFSEECQVPWEVMHPGVDDMPDADHLYMDHPVARWPLSVATMPPEKLPSGKVASFVPDYPGDATLPAARREQEWLVRRLGATAEVPRKSEFIALMEGGSDVGIVHFAGHGQADTGLRDNGLKMEDGAVVLDDIMHGGVMLGRRCRSLVVLNACEAANEEAALGFVEGWGPGLARQHFGAVIAPLWRVRDEASADFMISALNGLAFAGLTLGEAMRLARRSAAGSSATAFAYVAYGDVMASMARIRP